MKVAVIYNKKQAEYSDVINIFGPQTKERYNPKTIEKVATALEKGGHNVKVIEGNIDLAEKLRNFMPKVIAGERPGIVFNMAYGIQGQSRYTHIPSMLEMLGVPYVGSGPQAHAVALDKVMSKILFKQHNLSTPDFWVFSNPNENLDDVIYPVIVKPKMEAVSMGLKIVENKDDLRDAIAYIIETYQQQALVEAFIPGKEFAVGILGNGLDQEILPIVEFNFGDDPNAIQTYDDKLNKPVDKICPANIDDNNAAEMKYLAQGTFNALGIYDFGRVDLRMDKDGKIYILEINSMASLGLTGSYVHAAKIAGYTFDLLVNRMLDVAAVRYFGEAYKQTDEIDESETTKSEPLRVRIRSYLRSNLTTMEDTLRRMLDINTYVHNTEGVNTLGNLIANRLEGRLGFHRQVFPQVQVGNILYFTNHNDEKGDILLLSHLDNQYNYQDYTPFREERGFIFGSGVAESKGGLTIMLSALQALKYARRVRRVKCGILLTTDDSMGGFFSRKLIEEISQKHKYVIGLENGEIKGGIVTSCYGKAKYQIELANIKMPEMTTVPDPIFEICKKIVAIQKLSSKDEGVFIKPTSLDARTLSSIAPDYAMVSLDIQFREKSQGEKIIDTINEIARKNLNTKFQIRTKKGIYRPPIQETELNKRFYEIVQEIAQRLEILIKPVNRLTSSDICYIPKDIPVLEGFGPVGRGTNSPNECIFIDSLVDRATLLAMVINKISRM
ncbi:M20/M25/M40 family metallo-hydrolase [candidate division KSB1 bacterium]